MIKRLVILCLAFFCGTSLVYAGNSFSIAPVHVVVSLERPQTIAFIVKNTGDSLIHLRLEPEFLPLGSNGYNLGQSSLTQAQEQATSLVPYIILSPAALSLEPSEQRQVRVSVHIPPHAVAGTYRANIAAKMLEFAYQTSSKNTNDAANIGVQLNLLLKISTALYGNVGTPKITPPVFKCKKNKDGFLVFDVTNSTPWHMSLDLSGYPKTTDANTTALFKAHGEIFRNSVSYVQTSWKPQNNEKQLLIKWSNADNEKEVGQAQCEL